MHAGRQALPVAFIPLTAFPFSFLFFLFSFLSVQPLAEDQRGGAPSGVQAEPRGPPQAQRHLGTFEREA